MLPIQMKKAIRTCMNYDVSIEVERQLKLIVYSTILIHIYIHYLSEEAIAFTTTTI